MLPAALVPVLFGLGCETNPDQLHARYPDEPLPTEAAQTATARTSPRTEQTEAKAEGRNEQAQSLVGEPRNRLDEPSFRETKAKAQAGDAVAQNRLGLAYVRGQGVPTNLVESVKWFRKAAEQGYARGQVNLGLSYEKGRGVTQDYAEAAKWYRFAADQGDPHAQFSLGVFYTYGRGVAQDHAEATGWYRQAAEQGNLKAQNNLALSYARGDGIIRHYAEILKWLRNAAEQGDEKARMNLNMLFPTIRTFDGETYEYAVVTSVTRDSLFIKYTSKVGSAGLAQVRFENLPDYLQQRYRNSRQKAAAAYDAARREEIARRQTTRSAGAFAMAQEQITGEDEALKELDNIERSLQADE
jgi:TPR repeat protein